MAKTPSKYMNGGDQKAIAKIAEEHYGGYVELLTAHGWPRTSQPIMNDVSKGIIKRYGSIEEFETYHIAKPRGYFETAHDLLDTYDGAWMKGFWGWSPDSWGCVGYGSAKRRNTFFQNALQTRLMFVYVTHSAKSEETTPKNLINRIVGFYLLTEVEGYRNQFQEQFQHKRHPEKWQFSIGASRAFTIRSTPLPYTYDADPIFKTKGMGTRYGTNSDALSAEAYEYLKTCTYEEVPVYGSSMMGLSGLSFPRKHAAKRKDSNKRSKPVQGGAPNTSGYYVKPELDSKKSLYILELCGNIDAYLGGDFTGKKIIKVGLSYSPESRRDFFNRVIPEGEFCWKIIKSTLNDDDDLYSCYRVAEKGEMKMKEFFHSNPEDHLSGEFYLTDKTQIENAWKLGREAALQEEKIQNG